jgi:single-strand DNA-binding protein
MNLCILKGRLGADPELTMTNSGSQVAKLRLATSRKWTDKDSGQRQERTEWHRVVLWNRLADIAGQYLAKGREVLITGEIQYRQYQDKEGRQVWITEIEGRELELIGGRDTASGPAPTHAPTQAPAPAPAPAPHGGYTPPAASDLDDDIPF